MPVVINGSTGISGTDGSAGTPALQGTDGNTGMFFPAADQIAFAEGGVEAMRLDASGNVGIGTTTPNFILDVVGSGTSTSHRGNVNLQARSNGSGRNSTIRLSDSVANSADISMLGGVVQFSSNGIVASAIDSGGNLQFNSGYGSVATAFGCRAWVNFNGQGTVAIRASGNVSSITDGGTGLYTVNFATAMPDGNYSAVKSENYWSLGDIFNFNVNNVTLRVYESFSATIDTAIVCVAVFR